MTGFSAGVAEAPVTLVHPAAGPLLQTVADRCVIADSGIAFSRDPPKLRRTDT